MEYTAEKLHEMNLYSVTVIDKKLGEIYYFFSVNRGLEDYLLNDYTDDAAVYCYVLDLNGKQISDQEVSSIDLFLKYVNSGNEIRFNEERDMSKFQTILGMDD